MVVAEHLRAAPARGAMRVNKRLRVDLEPGGRLGVNVARGRGPQVLGYYHSHPSGPAHPSATDQALATGDGRIWAIVARDALTFWRDEPGGFVPLGRS
jgi:hypothetical protein